ncbi:hypothetical protein CcI49_03485 [Frankia sp. CcI49]|uniref:hypothetical protein n=1 Tax=Frankia sp. CcI49 TaxID=1745382 RepID=UPI000977AF66|nr:hypothetical protein [Frankia sp. CcI49]ONH61883.1 hypothetical protein CcI49_03485 [Frankia sp. CcI49]
MTMSTGHRVRAQVAWVVVIAVMALLGLGAGTDGWAGGHPPGGIGGVATTSALSTVPPLQGGPPFPHLDHGAHLANSSPSWAGGHEVGLAAALVPLVLAAVFLGWRCSRCAARPLRPVGPGGARDPPTRGGRPV